MITRWLDPEWRVAHKFASIWVAAFWGAFGGVLIFLPALAGLIPNWLFGILCVGMSATFAIARLLNQPGAV
jgi:hypothetical protein